MFATAPCDDQDRESGVPGQRQVDQRPAHSVLDDDEHGQRDEGSGERRSRQRRGPSPMRCAVKCQREQADSERDQGKPCDVDAPRHALIGRLFDAPRADGQRYQRQRNIEPEDPSPPDRLGEQPADQRSRRIAQSGYAIGQSDGVTGAHRGKGVRQDTHRNRKDQCRTETLDRAEDDDKRRRRRQRAQRRRHPEQRDARQQRAPTPEDVADAARGHHEGAECEHVDADHPLQIGSGAVQFGCHPRQRQIHREIVDLDAEQRHRHGRKDPPGFHRLPAPRSRPEDTAHHARIGR